MRTDDIKYKIEDKYTNDKHADISLTFTNHDYNISLTFTDHDYNPPIYS